MSYVQYGKMVTSGHHERGAYPDLIQFCTDMQHHLVAIAVDGTVWRIKEGKAEQIVGFNNIAIACPTRNSNLLSFITTEGNVIIACVGPDLDVTITKKISLPERIAQVLDAHMICSDGSAYEYSRNRGECVRIFEGIKITEIGIAYAQTAMLSSDGIVYNISGDIIFNREPVIKLTNVMLTKRGGLYIWIDNYDYSGEMIGILKPKDVMQINFNGYTCQVLYFNRRMDVYVYDLQGYVTLTKTVHDVDCINGQYTRPARPKSARALA